MKEAKGLKVERIALHGYGIAHFQGKTIFIPYTAIGDIVDIRITQEKKDIAFGSVIRYQSRPKEIIEAPCEAFGPKGQCGGCDWLMAPYKTQLRWKDILIKGIFEPFVDPALIQEITPSPVEYGYRNKAFFPVSSRKGRLIFGMYQSWTHTVIPHKACQIQMPIFDKIAQRVIELAQKSKVQAYEETKHAGNLRQIGFRSSSDGKEILLILVTKSARLPFSNLLVKQITSEFPLITGIIQNIQRNRSNVILGDDDRVLWGKAFITERFHGLSFRVHYRSFLQVNPGASSLIVDTLREQLGSAKRVIDAYSGIGTIGLSLASQIRELSLIEEVPEAVEDARRNAELNKIKDVEFYCGRVEDLLGKVITRDQYAIILDPPRSGLAEQVPGVIARARIPKVLYLSCNPMTLARDLKSFLAKGYSLKLLKPFDMFPQTWHIETLAVLERT